MRISSFLTIGATAGLLASCEPKLDAVPAPSAGSLDLSRFVAIGDDYVAGVANGGLTRERQEYSLANLLARQFQLAGGGAFVQPLLQPNEITGGLTLAGLTARNQLLASPAPVSYSDRAFVNPGGPCEEIRYRFPAWEGAAAGTIPNNLGVPGLRLLDAVTVGLGDEANLHTTGAPYNGYLERLLPDAADSRSYLSLVRAARPTFFIVSLGFNNVLQFVQSGGSSCTPLPTSNAVIGQQAKQLLDSLLAATPGARGVIIGSPVLGNLPLTKTLVGDLNRQLGRADQAPMFVRNSSGVVEVVPSTHVILLPMVGRVGRLETATGTAADSAFGLTRANPLRDQDVLTDRQITDTNARINGRQGLNETLRTQATESGGRVVYFDLSSIFGSMANGSYVDGIRYSADPVTGGLFSLDGYTLTPRGNAYLANAIIRALNSTNPVQGFSTRIPQVDISALPATSLP